MTAVPPLRADAQRNRERLLAAAEDVFLERGAEASMEDVAKRAGVGIGTLYRRFPTRDALFAAAYSERFLSLAAASHARAETLDPLTALRRYLEELVAHTSVYRGLAASLGAMLQSGTPGCEATSKEGKRLLKQAQKAGVVRKRVTFDDLVAVAMATSLATEQATAQATEQATAQATDPATDQSTKPTTGHTTGPASSTRVTRLIGLFFDGIASGKP